MLPKSCAGLLVGVGAGAGAGGGPRAGRTIDPGGNANRRGQVADLSAARGDAAGDLRGDLASDRADA